jgi:hypothetical protein
MLGCVDCVTIDGNWSWVVIAALILAIICVLALLRIGGRL